MDACSALEASTHSEREPHQLPASPAVRIRVDVTRSWETTIMAVRRHPAASGAQVVVSVLVVDGIGPRQVDQDVVAEVVLDRGCDHVRRVVGVQPSSSETVSDVVDRGVVLPRVAGSLEGVSPAEMQGVRLGQPLADGQPEASPLPFVLELQLLRNVSVKVLEESAQRRARRKDYLRAD